MTFQTLSRESSQTLDKRFFRVRLAFMVVMNDAKSCPDGGQRVRDAKNSCVTNYSLKSIGKLLLGGIGSSLSIFCHLNVALEWLCKLALRAGKRAAIRKAIVVASPRSVSFRRNLNCDAFAMMRAEKLMRMMWKKVWRVGIRWWRKASARCDVNSLLRYPFAPIFHSSTILQMGS